MILIRVDNALRCRNWVKCKSQNETRWLVHINKPALAPRPRAWSNVVIVQSNSVRQYHHWSGGGIQNVR